MTEPVALAAAFAGGLLSFLSPCVLPLIPGYLSYISGLSVDELRGASGAAAAGVGALPTAAQARRRVLVSSMAFCAGFAAVFVLLGAAAAAIGLAVLTRVALFETMAGAIVVLFGLHSLGALRIAWLSRDRRVRLSRKPAGPGGAALVGVAFALGWTPCLGPMLAALLAVAATGETVGAGLRVLGAFSAGLAVPFVAAGLAVDHFFSAFAVVRRYYHRVEVVSGGLLVGIGVLIVTNRIALLSQWLAPSLPPR